MMEANNNPSEKGRILEQVIVKISWQVTVPMNRPRRISFVHRFTASADLQKDAAATLDHVKDLL